MRTLLIGNGYWGKIVKSKLEVLTDLVFVADSKIDIDFIIDNYEIDYIFICSSTKSHYEVVKKCIDKNKNVFCEKPFTGNIDKSIELYKISVDNNTKIYVNNIFLYRKEFLQINRDFKEIKFIWNKFDENYNENLYDSLFYHDLYMLIELTDDNWVIKKKNIDDKKLHIEMFNGDRVANFQYDRTINKKEKIIITDNENIIDFNNPTNDPLSDIIINIINNNINYDYNKDITLKTLSFIKKIKLKLK
jgi:hypothetical protein